MTGSTGSSRIVTTVADATSRPLAALAAETARVSPDPRLRAMAKILELITVLVPAQLAVFYAVNHRLQYSDDPVVVLLAPPRGYDVPRLLRRHREEVGISGPFAAQRVPQGVRVLTVQDLTPEGRRTLQWEPDSPVTPRANIYLRDVGHIVAGITLMRSPGIPDLSFVDVAAIRRAHPLSEEAYVMARRASAATPADHPLERAELTPREREIADLIALAASNTEIAQTLHISRNTVKIHVRNLLAKLGVANRQQAMILLGSHSGPSVSLTEPAASEHA